MACLAGAVGLALGVACAAGALWLGVEQALSTEGRSFGKVLGEFGALLLAGLAFSALQAGVLLTVIGVGAWRRRRPAYLAGAALCLMLWASPWGRLILSGKGGLVALSLNVTMGGSLLGAWLASRPGRGVKQGPALL